MTKRATGRPHVRATVEEMVSLEEGSDSPEQMLENQEEADLEQLGVVEGVLDESQKRTLVELNRIESSLHGPETLLAVAGGFSRPTPPAHTHSQKYGR